MGLLRSLPRNSPVLALLLVLAPAACAADVPAGTELEVRLKTQLSTQTARAQDPVEAVVLAPVLVAGEFLIPAGARVHGTVEKVVHSTEADQRSSFTLAFTGIEFGSRKLPLAARPRAVDNAREKVDDNGVISGILASETATGRLDAGLEKLAERAAGFAEVLQAAKGAILKPAESGVAFPPGVEMTLTLTAALTVPEPSGPGEMAVRLKPVADEAALARLVDAEPFQTVAQNPPMPSDITNLLLIGSQEQVSRAFAEAGWSTAAVLSARAKFETFRALAENRGYNEAPVSILMLEGRPPDLVFQKMNNTFARRHHLRVWKRPATFENRPVWAVAATHDTGIAFSETNRTFIHRIDGQIDRERAKVVNDLLLTGHVASLELVDRPKVPTRSQNATGDALETDGRVAVLVLQ
jgi:hypothetical protein